MVVCWAGLKTGVFHWQPPVWLTLEGLGKAACCGVVAVAQMGERLYHSMVALVSEIGSTIASGLFSACHRLDHERGSTGNGIALSDISADAALLMMTLALLIVFYMYVDFDSLNLRVPLSLQNWIRLSVR